MADSSNNGTIDLNEIAKARKFSIKLEEAEQGDPKFPLRKVITDSAGGSTIDLNEIAKTRKLSLNLEEAEDEGDSGLRRRKEWITYCVTVICVVVVLGIVVGVALIGTGEDRRWAMAIVGSTLGGMVGYLIGKKA